MRVTIDMQGVQKACLRNSHLMPNLSALKEFVSKRQSHEVFLIFRGELSQSIESLRATFEDLVVPQNMRISHVPSLLDITSSGRHWQRSVASIIHKTVEYDSRADIVLSTHLADRGDALILETPAPFAHTLRLDLQHSADAAWEFLLKHSLPSAPEQLRVLDSAGGHQKPRLAFVSPLPPQRSGVADYAAQLLQQLCNYYDIDVVALQPMEPATPLDSRLTLRSIGWLREQVSTDLRVLYHFGNSPFHHAMFDLLERVPGVVVLHDFYLSDVQLYREAHHLAHAWSWALYDSHGYVALLDRFDPALVGTVQMKYPSNLAVLQQAQGIITHSDHPRQLAKLWYGPDLSIPWKTIPLMRLPAAVNNRASTRALLGYQPDDFVVSTFGLIGPGKRSLEILHAWLSSKLALDARCLLVFVGQNDADSYGEELALTIDKCGLGRRVTITGWVDESRYIEHLAAADLAVQLRVDSRGETSAAVLDCMNHGLATLMNANTAMSGFPTDAVWYLDEHVSGADLTTALEQAWNNPDQLDAMGKRAQQHVHTNHSPQVCADGYFKSIESFHASAMQGRQGAIHKIAQLAAYAPEPVEYSSAAQALADSSGTQARQRQLLIDVSAVCRKDLKTGIQRVVRALANQLMRSPPVGIRVEPVYLSDEGDRWHYRYARRWSCAVLGLQNTGLHDEVAEYAPGDILLVADYTGDFTALADSAGVLSRLKQAGVRLQFVVYDLLPALIPEVFPPGLHSFMEWLQTVCRVADGVSCISKTVADDLQAWVERNPCLRHKPLKIDWFHLGADVESSVPSKGVPSDVAAVLTRLSEVPTFVMVGTIEPRKGYIQAINGFSQLWDSGVEVNLVIVGHEGWQGMPDADRRDIPDTITVLRDHPKMGSHLFWLNGISDEYLELIYQSSNCLLTASKGEGFGLPLIEAARRNLPILARDLPVFREVAGPYAQYFEGFEPADVSNAVLEWLALRGNGKNVQSNGMPTRSWADSAGHLLRTFIPELQVNP